MTLNFIWLIVTLVHETQKQNRKIADSSFQVSWTFGLGNNEQLLESDFLRASFEQGIKDYINNDILCRDNEEFKGAKFYGVSIGMNDVDASDNNNLNKRKAVSGNGICKGDLSKCKKPLKAKKKYQATLDNLESLENQENNNTKSSSQQLTDSNHNKDSFCEDFLASTIFDMFEKRVVTASAFQYNADVGTINDLKGSVDLKYEVSFEAVAEAGLNQVDEVDLEPDDPVEISSDCDDAECFMQRDTMRNIYRHFGLLFDEDKHECMIQGVNCNEKDMITHIWMGKCG